MRKVRLTKNPDSEDLDLAPMLAMIVSLIPILLMSFSFYKTSVNEVKLPAAQSSQSKDKKSYQVLLKVKNNRSVQLEVKRNKKRVMRRMIGARQGKVNLEKLREVAMMVNHKFPWVQSIQLLPAKDLSYKELTHIIDEMKGSGAKKELYKSVYFANLLQEGK